MPHEWSVEGFLHLLSLGAALQLEASSSKAFPDHPQAYRVSTHSPMTIRELIWLLRRYIARGELSVKEGGVGFNGGNINQQRWLGRRLSDHLAQSSGIPPRQSSKRALWLLETSSWLKWLYAKLCFRTRLESLGSQAVDSTDNAPIYPILTIYYFPRRRDIFHPWDR